MKGPLCHLSLFLSRLYGGLHPHVRTVYGGIPTLNLQRLIRQGCLKFVARH